MMQVISCEIRTSITLRSSRLKKETIRKREKKRRDPLTKRRINTRNIRKVLRP
jgi:hypothetical protein